MVMETVQIPEGDGTRDSNVAAMRAEAQKRFDEDPIRGRGYTCKLAVELIIAMQDAHIAVNDDDSVSAEDYVGRVVPGAIASALATMTQNVSVPTPDARRRVLLALAKRLNELLLDAAADIG